MKNSKIFKIIKTIFSTAVVLILIGFVIVVCLQRISNNKISFFNYRMFTVISGSMEPRYKIGDVLISKTVKPSEIKVGDTISYEGKVGDFKNKVITHEVIEIEKNNEGNLIFHAKGLANLVEDPKVLADQIYGVVVYKSFFLSIIYRIVATNIGFYLFIILPILYIIGSEVISTMLKKEQKRREKENII